MKHNALEIILAETRIHETLTLEVFISKAENKLKREGPHAPMKYHIAPKHHLPVESTLIYSKL